MHKSILALVITVILTASAFGLSNQAFAMLPGTGATSAIPCPPECFGITLSPSVLGNSIIQSLQTGQFIDRFGPSLTPLPPLPPFPPFPGQLIDRSDNTFAQSFQHDHTVLGTPELGLSPGNGAGLVGSCVRSPSGAFNCF